MVKLYLLRIAVLTLKSTLGAIKRTLALKASIMNLITRGT